MIQWRCPSCEEILRTEDRNAGKKTRCTDCKAVVLIPRPHVRVEKKAETSWLEHTPNDRSEDMDERMSESELPETDTAEKETPKIPPALVAPANHAKKRFRLLVGIAGGAIFLVGVAVLGTLWATGGLFRSTNPETFKGLYRVTKEIEASQDTGLTPADFRKLLQQYATELSVAKDSAKTDKEKKILAFHGEALEIYKDSAALWDAEISVRDARIFMDGGDLDNLGKQIAHSLAFERLLTFNRLPIQDYFTKKKNGLAIFAERYNLPVKEQNGWSYIQQDSFHSLWLRARQKVADANSLLKGS